MAQFVKVTTVDDVPPETMKGFEVENLDIVVVNTGGQVYALSNICTHAFCYMSYGIIDGDAIICTCHGADYALEDGKSLSTMADKPLATYEIRINGNDISISIPDQS